MGVVFVPVTVTCLAWCEFCMELDLVRKHTHVIFATLTLGVSNGSRPGGPASTESLPHFLPGEGGNVVRIHRKQGHQACSHFIPQWCMAAASTVDSVFKFTVTLSVVGEGVAMCSLEL